MQDEIDSVNKMRYNNYF